MKEDELIQALACDKIEQCLSQYAPTNTGFLDMHQQSLVADVLRREKPSEEEALCYLAGGYPQAERRIFFCRPPFVPESLSEYIKVLHVEAGTAGKKLTHRDYLGSVLGTGIERSEVGDILVREDGADLIVTTGISEYLMQNFVSVGHTAIHTELRETDELILPTARTKDIFTSVATPRLDSLVSGIFAISRTKAQAQIKAGRVFVDSMEVLKPEKQIASGQRIVVRGLGKAEVSEVSETTTKKGRIRVSAKRFL